MTWRLSKPRSQARSSPAICTFRPPPAQPTPMPSQRRATVRPHGSVFFADEQTAGRGRGDHSWESTPGDGLYVSVLLRLALPSARVPMLPLVAGLAALDAIRTASGLTADLRWPNDLLIGERKTGGILVESKTEEGALAFAVVGIGINVHQRSFSRPRHARHLSRSRIVPSRHPPAAADRPARIAGARGGSSGRTPMQRRPFFPASSKLLRGRGDAKLRCTDRKPAPASPPASMKMDFCW